MTVETHEDEARRMIMEITRRSVTVTAHLAHSTWLEVRQFVGQRLSGGQQEPRIGRRVTTTELEQATRGQRESVNLSDPRIAKLVQKELNRYGVTFAITRDAEGTRVHIGAGNATQLDTAMRRAEQTLARQLEARQARADRRAGIEVTDTEDRSVTQERASVDPARQPTAPPVTDPYRDVAREALSEDLANQVLREDAWPVLSNALGEAEAAGLDPSAVLASVVRTRETFSAQSVCAVLAWRVDNALANPTPAMSRPRERAAGEQSEPGKTRPQEQEAGPQKTGPQRTDGGPTVKPRSVPAVDDSDPRAVARAALNERAKAMPKAAVKGDVVDLATEKPTRGLDLGGPRR